MKSNNEVWWSKQASTLLQWTHLGLLGHRICFLGCALGYFALEQTAQPCEWIYDVLNPWHFHSGGKSILEHWHSDTDTIPVSLIRQDRDAITNSFRQVKRVKSKVLLCAGSWDYRPPHLPFLGSHCSWFHDDCTSLHGHCKTWSDCRWEMTQPSKSEKLMTLENHVQTRREPFCLRSPISLKSAATRNVTQMSLRFQQSMSFVHHEGDSFIFCLTER